MLVNTDSGTVVMEVKFREGVCKNSPAEWSSTGKWWRFSKFPTLHEALEVILSLPEISADLGGSSKHWNANFEDWSEKGDNSAEIDLMSIEMEWD